MIMVIVLFEVERVSSMENQDWKSCCQTKSTKMIKMWSTLNTIVTEVHPAHIPAN